MSETDEKNLMEEEEDNDNEFEIESIISHRKRGKKMEYLIKWVGYSIEESTWEPEENLQKGKEILSSYWESVEKKKQGTKKEKTKTTAKNKVAKISVNIIGIIPNKNSKKGYSYAVKYNNSNECTLLTSEYMKDNFPKETIEFLENNIKFDFNNNVDFKLTNK